MQLTKRYKRIASQFLGKPENRDRLRLLAVFGVPVISILVFWFVAPHLAWGEFAPLVTPAKRIYFILLIFLVWLLKYIAIDLNAPNPAQYEGEETQKNLIDLQHRFQGALDFLQKTRISRQNRQIRLSELPWYLLIGQEHAGKTTLLAKSGINFLLQRRHQDDVITETRHYDWFITRDAAIIDVPGRFLPSGSDADSRNSAVWQYFLRLARKFRGRKGIKGIIIALPLPELLRTGDQQRHQEMLDKLLHSLQDLNRIFPRAIPCHLVITKCDLLPGFAEFFADAGNEEISQPWNVLLTTDTAEAPAETFINRFNLLIRKLNQQLLWRLHRERDPMMRPYIKDFPLQVELLKEFILDFIKKFTAANLALEINSVYLTSALQEQNEEVPLEVEFAENDDLESINVTERAVRIFEQPQPSSRAYFIRQFLSTGLGSSQDPAHILNNPWVRKTAYASMAGAIGLSLVMLAHDFRQGLKQAYTVKNNIDDYQLVIRKIQNPDDQLLKTLQLLNSLQQSASASEAGKFDFAHLISFYTKKSMQKTGESYQRALESVLIPEMTHYLADFLTLPVNRNPENVYEALKSYLMLGDAGHFQAWYIENTMRRIMPESIKPAEAEQLLAHIHNALAAYWTPQVLDQTLIERARQFFSAMPGYQLGYIILQNTNINNSEVEVGLNGTQETPAALFSEQNSNKIPYMFTARAFPAIVNQDCVIAAQEALMGNWILGTIIANRNPTMMDGLVEQLRTAYLGGYINAWERLIDHVRVSAPSDLAQTDMLIMQLISSNSPMLQMLQVLHDNTWFEPVASASPALQNIDLLLENRNQAANQLYQIFASLQMLHEYLQSVLTAQDERKAAFILVSNRMSTRGTLDAITQLRLVASHSPEPVKNWLNSVADHSWYFLMKDAGNYIDTSWREQVIHVYQTDIANRYPFNPASDQEVDIQRFVSFFGNPGTVTNFYNYYLRQLVDTSTPEWRWKSLDNIKMPFNDETLRQIQQAMRIHHSFFPNGDNKMFMQFSLQPYMIGRHIKSITLNINDRQFIDEQKGAKTPHVIVWPDANEPNKMAAAGAKKTSVQLMLNNRKTVRQDFSGEWGWFRLISKSFETIVSKKEIMLNLSRNENPAKYLLFMSGQSNQLPALDMSHFQLPAKLSEEDA